MSIGVAFGDPEYELHLVRSVTRLDDGRIAVLNAATPEVRFYNADGTYAMAVGRRGDGPGEFRTPLRMERTANGDLRVFDLDLRRMTIISSSGEYIDSRSLDTSLSGFMGGLGPGTLLMGRPIGERFDGEGLLDTRATYWYLEIETGQADTVLTAGNSQTYQTVVGVEVVQARVPFTRDAPATVHDGRFYISPTPAPEIRVYDEAAALVRIIRMDLEPEPVTRQEFRALAEAAIREGAPRRQATLRRLHDMMPMPAVKPLFDRLRVSNEGDIWIRHFEPLPQEEGRWLVFNAAGRAIAAARLPGILNLREIGSDYVLGTSSDEMGAEQVHLYRLVRYSDNR